MPCECRAQLEEPQHSRISLKLLGGIQRRHPVENFPDEDWDEVLQVNLNTVFAITRDAGESELGAAARPPSRPCSPPKIPEITPLSSSVILPTRER